MVAGVQVAAAGPVGAVFVDESCEAQAATAARAETATIITPVRTGRTVRIEGS
jgi:hypothetical protein